MMKWKLDRTRSSTLERDKRRCTICGVLIKKGLEIILGKEKQYRLCPLHAKMYKSGIMFVCGVDDFDHMPHDDHDIVNIYRVIPPNMPESVSDPEEMTLGWSFGYYAIIDSEEVLSILPDDLFSLLLEYRIVVGPVDMVRDVRKEIAAQDLKHEHPIH